MPNKPRHARPNEPYTDRQQRAKPVPASTGLGILAQRNTGRHMMTFKRGLSLPRPR